MQLLSPIKVFQRVPNHHIDFHENIWTHVDEFFLTDPTGVQLKVIKAHKLAIIGLPEIQYFIKVQGFKEIRTYNSFESRESEKIVSSRILISAQRKL